SRSIRAERFACRCGWLIRKPAKSWRTRVLRARSARAAVAATAVIVAVTAGGREATAAAAVTVVRVEKGTGTGMTVRAGIVTKAVTRAAAIPITCRLS